MARDKSTTLEQPQEAPETQSAQDGPTPSTAVVKAGKAKKGDVLVMMTPEEAKEASKQIKRDLTHAGQLLLEMRDREGWKALGYSGFVEWAKAEVGKSSATVYRYLNVAVEERAAQATQARLTSGMPVDDAPADDKPRRGRPKGSGKGRAPLSPEDAEAAAEGRAIIERASALISGDSVPKPTSNGKRHGQVLDAPYLWKPAVRDLENAERALDTTERAVMSLMHEERAEYARRLQDVSDMLGRRVEKIHSIEASNTAWDDDMAGAPIEYEVTPPEEASDEIPAEV